MQFTKAQIEKGIVVAYCGQSRMAHSKKEAITAINSFKANSGYAMTGQNLVCNEYTDKFLTKLFNGECVSGNEVKTTYCGRHGIRFYEAMAETIEEHNRLYNEQREALRKKQAAEAAEAYERLKTEFNEQHEGWYHVSVAVTAIDMQTERIKYLDYSGDGIATSKMDAYDKFTKGINDDCCKDGLILESISPWNSGETEVTYIGTRTDDLQNN